MVLEGGEGDEFVRNAWDLPWCVLPCVGGSLARDELSANVLSRVESHDKSGGGLDELKQAALMYSTR